MMCDVSAKMRSSKARWTLYGILDKNSVSKNGPFVIFNRNNKIKKSTRYVHLLSIFLNVPWVLAEIRAGHGPPPHIHLNRKPAEEHDLIPSPLGMQRSSGFQYPRGTSPCC